jgi:hypothetical protein
MAVDFAANLKQQIRLEARRAFVAAVRDMADQARTDPGNGRGGGGGIIPKDKGALQSGIEVSITSATTDVMRAEVRSTTTNRGFDYPAHLDQSGSLGGSRATGRSARYLANLKGGGAPVGNPHAGWFDRFFTDARWDAALQSQWSRLT